MKDILHQNLNIDDFVVVSKRYGYAGLNIVQIIGFTPKKVKTTDGLYPANEILKINEQRIVAIQANPELFL